MRRFKLARYEDGCTLGPKGPGGPDDYYEEPEEVEKCDGCGKPATLKLGTTPLCCGCNLECAVGEGVRSDFANCDGAD